MKKTLIALAVAAAVAAPGLAAAADVSGYTDINYIGAGSTSGAPASSTGKANQFGAGAEVNVRNTVDKVTVGLDLDLNLMVQDGIGSVNSTGKVGGNNYAMVEQAFFALKATDALTVIGGVFNNPLNYEHQDVVSRTMNSQGQIARIFDDQTALYENNLAGVAGAYNMGMATATVAVLDQLGHASNSNKSAQNSYAAQIALAPMEGLTLKAGIVTQNKNVGTSGAGTYGTSGFGNAGNVWDVNAEYKAGALTVAAEVIGAEELIDTAYGLYGKFKVTDAIAIGARYDDVNYSVDKKNTTSAAVNASYTLAKNLSTALEYRTDDNGKDTDDSVRVKFVAKF